MSPSDTERPVEEIDDDPELIAALIAGRPGAAETFVRRYAPMIRALAMNRFHCDEATARDLFQRLFLHLYEDDWRRLRLWNGRGRLAGYLHTIARRLLFEELERCGRVVPESALRAPDRETDLVEMWDGEDERCEASDTLDRTALERCLQEAFERLTPRYRQLLRLRHWRGLRHREIAELEGIQLNNLSVTLGRAERALAAWMERLCGHLLDRIGKEVP